MEIEITPEPSDEERAAILAALAQEGGQRPPAPAPWLEEPVEHP